MLEKNLIFGPVTIKNRELMKLGMFIYKIFKTTQRSNRGYSKQIDLREPDGDDVNYIKGDYECDQFIDCHNMSDEGYQCTPSFIIAFIIVGILTGIVILVSCLLLPVVLVFGICVRRHRIFLSGTVFLIILVLSSLLGFVSTYAWYGKPHVVSCNFQLWLFGLATTALAWLVDQCIIIFYRV